MDKGRGQEQGSGLYRCRLQALGTECRIFQAVNFGGWSGRGDRVYGVQKRRSAGMVSGRRPSLGSWVLRCFRDGG